MSFKQFLIESKPISFHKDEMKLFKKKKLSDVEKLEGQLDFVPNFKLKDNEYLWLKWKIVDRENRLSVIDKRRKGLESELKNWKNKKYKKNSLKVQAKNDPDERMYRIDDVNEKRRVGTVSSIGRQLKDLDDVEKRLKKEVKELRKQLIHMVIPLDSPDHEFYGKSEKEIEQIKAKQSNELDDAAMKILGIDWLTN